MGDVVTMMPLWMSVLFLSVIPCMAAFGFWALSPKYNLVEQVILSVGARCTLLHALCLPTSHIAHLTSEIRNLQSTIKESSSQ